MVTGYRGGWFTLNPDDDEDASIGDSTSSRLLNYYIGKSLRNPQPGLISSCLRTSRRPFRGPGLVVPRDAPRRPVLRRQ